MSNNKTNKNSNLSQHKGKRKARWDRIIGAFALSIATILGIGQLKDKKDVVEPINAYTDQLLNKNDENQEEMNNLSEEQREEFIKYIQNVRSYGECKKEEDCTTQELKEKVSLAEQIEDYSNTELRNVAEQILKKKIENLAELDGGLFDASVKLENSDMDKQNSIKVKGDFWYKGMHEDKEYEINKLPKDMQTVADFVANKDKKITANESVNIANNLLTTIFDDNRIIDYQNIKYASDERIEEEREEYLKRKKDINKEIFNQYYAEKYKNEGKEQDIQVLER